MRQVTGRLLRCGDCLAAEFVRLAVFVGRQHFIFHCLQVLKSGQGSPLELIVWDDVWHLVPSHATLLLVFLDTVDLGYRENFCLCLSDFLQLLPFLELFRRIFVCFQISELVLPVKVLVLLEQVLPLCDLEVHVLDLAKQVGAAFVPEDCLV